MSNPLAQQHNMRTLIRFALPNIIMMLFLSMYSIVDGIIVSRMVGLTALSALNMFFPFVSLQLALGIMIAVGGSAIIAKKLGEKKPEEARGVFSFLTLFTAGLAVFSAILGILFLDEIIRFLGANDAQFELCRSYARILIICSPLYLLQTLFQILLITAGKPTLGLILTVTAGCANMVLDYIFIGPFGMGIEGAAYATCIGFSIPTGGGLIYFFKKRGGLYFVKPIYQLKILLKTCSNGSSEMVGNLATAVTTLLFNYTLISLWAEEGVAAFTIIMYAQFVLVAVHFGYSIGVSPIISYKFGSGEKKQLRDIIKSSFKFTLYASVISFFLCQFLATPITAIFTSADSAVYDIAVEGMHIFSVSFLFVGVGIFASAMFTALSDGRPSAIIAFARTLLFLVPAIWLMPRLFGSSGIWWAVPIAEILGTAVAAIYLYNPQFSKLRLMRERAMKSL